MPTGIPRLQSRIDDLMAKPEAEDLGTIKPSITDSQPSASWTSETGTQIDMSEPPPPWELKAGSELAQSDARNFVEVPENWELRWINPRVLDQTGWRYWQPVMASDNRVKVKVPTMVSPEGNIRRGGLGGDILGWMYKSWVAARRVELQKRSKQLKDSSVSRMQRLQEESYRGSFGPNITIDTAKHPTHTMGEGRSMTDK